MPFKMTNFLEDKLANFFLRGVNFTFPSQLYLGLFTSFVDSNDGSSFTEVSNSGTGYTRRVTSWTAPSNGATENSAAVTFPVATANFGTTIRFGLFDAISGGNMYYWGEPQAATGCNTGEQLEFLAGELDLSIINNPSGAVANDIINMTLRNTPRSVPGAWYVALLTSYTSDVSYNEVVDGGYARLAVNFSVPSGGVTSNLSQLLFGAAVGPYTVTHMAIFDAVSGGNMIARGPLPVPKAVLATQQFKFAVGGLVVNFD